MRESQALETLVLKEAAVKKRQQKKEEGWMVEAWAGKASGREWPRAAPQQQDLQCFKGH